MSRLWAVAAVIPPVRGMETRTRHARPAPSPRRPKQLPYWFLALVVDVAAILLRPLWSVTDPPGRKRKPIRPGPGEITADLTGLVADREHLSCGYQLDDPAPAPTPVPARRRGAIARWWAEDHPGLYTLVISVLVLVIFASAAVSS